MNDYSLVMNQVLSTKSPLVKGVLDQSVKQDKCIMPSCQVKTELCIVQLL